MHADCFWQMGIDSNEEMKANKAKIVQKLIDMKANIMGTSKKAKCCLLTQIILLVLEYNLRVDFHPVQGYKRAMYDNIYAYDLREDEWTPLHYAAQSDQLEIIKILTSHGAKMTMVRSLIHWIWMVNDLTQI
jgi:ankyrin repeat protein